MCNRFLMLNTENEKDHEGDWLAEKHPHAFILLYFVARRARRYNGHIDGLIIGQCRVGDCEKMGLSRQEYRTALQLLVDKRLLEKVETCRNRKKSTTGSTTVGTLVRLCDNRIWDINSEDANHRINHRPTTGQPPANHEQEGIRKIKKEEEKKEDIAQTAPRLRKKSSISFDFDSSEFVGIIEKDKTNWRIMYPYIDIDVELLKMADWAQANPSKSRPRTQWLKFITGWLNRGNEKTETKKAYQSAFSNTTQDKTRENNAKHTTEHKVAPKYVANIVNFRSEDE
jgi:hypothetical protein